MLQIEEVGENNRQWIVENLKEDLVRNVFAFYDLQYDPQHSIMYVAVENGRLKGYILIYTALEFPSVILESDVETADMLVGHAPANHFIMHAMPNLLATIEGRFPNARHYDENWMLVKKGQARFFKSNDVRRLNVADGSRLASLLSTRRDRPRANDKHYADSIRLMPMYGVFMNGELVSFAGSFIQTPEIWMIGGVYTNPSCRNMGYATLATSAVTEEALTRSDQAALFVRSDNYSAIVAYEKIGYRKIGERLWVDVGTGMKP